MKRITLACLAAYSVTPAAAPADSGSITSVGMAGDNHFPESPQRSAS